MGTASEAQIRFITTLVGQKYPPEIAKGVIADMPWDELEGGKNGSASNMITKLMGMPDAPDPTLPETVKNAPRHGVNSSQGPCATCGHPVEANTGFYFGPFPEAKRWKTHHKVGECSTEPAPEPVKVEEGWYLVGSKLIQVYTTRNGRLAGKALNPATGKMEYQPGAMATCSTGIPIPEDQVADEICILTYGAPMGSDKLRQLALQHADAHSECMFCHLPLTDERSDPLQGGAGYGPVCAKKYRLPWG